MSFHDGSYLYFASICRSPLSIYHKAGRWWCFLLALESLYSSSIYEGWLFWVCQSWLAGWFSLTLGYETPFPTGLWSSCYLPCCFSTAPLKCDLMPFSCGFQNSLCAVLLRIWLWCLVARMFSSHVYLGSQEPSKILNLCQDWRTFQLLFHWLCFLRLYSLLESHNLSICSFNDVPKLSVKFIFLSFFLIVVFQKTGLQVSNISSVWTSFSLRFHLYFYLLTKLFISKISAGFFFKIYHFTRFLIHIIHCFADSVQCLYVFSCISMSILLIMLLTHQPPFL